MVAYAVVAFGREHHTPRWVSVSRQAERIGDPMDPVAEARRKAGLEIQTLAEDFERSDEAAFRRTRIVCWGIMATAPPILLILLVAGGDWRYLGAFWLFVVVFTWAGYWISTRRQREQTGRLRALATRWLTDV